MSMRRCEVCTAPESTKLPKGSIVLSWPDKKYDGSIGKWIGPIEGTYLEGDHYLCYDCKNYVDTKELSFKWNDFTINIK